jgi:hypothetical protein
MRFVLKLHRAIPVAAKAFCGVAAEAAEPYGDAYAIENADLLRVP